MSLLVFLKKIKINTKLWQNLSNLKKKMRSKIAFTAYTGLKFSNVTTLLFSYVFEVSIARI